MGLPGSGKTTFAERLQPLLNAVWINANKVRNLSNDWDFSENGRIRQSERMKIYADFEKSHGIIVSFKCTYGFSLLPLNEFGLCLSEVGLFS